MMRSLPRSGAVDAFVRDSERELSGAVGDDAESLARLQKTVTALAHVHAILVRLRARVEDVSNVGSGEK